VPPIVYTDRSCRSLKSNREQIEFSSVFGEFDSRHEPFVSSPEEPA
jgi:hypothetical protein